MTAIPNRELIRNPRVIHRTKTGSISEITKTGDYFRAFPSSWREVQFINSLELYVDRFAPAPNEGDGVIIPARVLDKVDDDKAFLTLPLLNPEDAKASGYRNKTSEINVRTEKKIILSIQSSMAGCDAVWIGPIKDGSSVYLVLGVKQSAKNEE